MRRIFNFSKAFALPFSALRDAKPSPPASRSVPARQMTSRTFCVLPWLHAATLTDGSVRLCCVSGGGSGVNLNEQNLADYWNSEYVKDARRRMLAGEPVKACQHCYREELHGYESHRMVENRVWKERCGEAGIDRLIGSTAADGSLDAPVQYIDL